MAQYKARRTLKKAATPAMLPVLAGALSQWINIPNVAEPDEYAFCLTVLSLLYGLARGLNNWRKNR